MAILDHFKTLSLAKLLLELTALVGLLILGFFVTVIAVDQFRHWTDPDHVATQRIKRDFMCFPQRGAEPEEPDKLLSLQFEVEALLDAARQEMAPTDFLGKLQRLGLCAEFNTINAGGLQFAAPAKSAQERQRLSAFRRGDDNPVQRRLVEIETLKKVLPDFPPAIHDRTTVLLREMLALYEDESGKARPEGDPVDDTTVDPGTAPQTDPGPAPAEAWLMIVGGDQTDAAALDQVAQTNKLLDAAGIWQRAEIYRIRSWRRTVVVFDSRAAAQAALDAVGADMPYGAYLRDVATWCDSLGAPTMLEGVQVTPCG